MAYTSKQSARNNQAAEESAAKLASAQQTTPAFSDQRVSTSVQLKQQQMMNASSDTNPLQRAEDEELLQGKFATAQLAEGEELFQGKFAPAQLMEEEEPLQGKFATAQLMEEEEPLQGKFETAQLAEEEELLQGKFSSLATAQLEEKPNNTGLPNQLKSGIESLSGMSMDGVKVHYNSDKPAQLNAHAYAQGTDIHVAPGQEQHLPHEAWHVVQQAQGRVKPTMQMKAGVPVNDDVGLETEADVMGAKAVQRRVLLPEHAYEDGHREPQIRTSVNFDNNHLTDAQVTHADAVNRRAARDRPRNTLINAAALIREVTNNDLDLINRTDTTATTTYNFNAPAEARQATIGGAAYAANVGLNSRQIGPNTIEIHHLHESQMAIHNDDFPSLSSSTKAK